jgi:hypothetical protein
MGATDEDWYLGHHPA